MTNPFYFSRKLKKNKTSTTDKYLRENLFP